MIDEGWWSGTVNGKTGLFPSNYVELVEGEEVGHDTHAATTTSSAPAAPIAHKGQGLCATALYEYEAAEEGEIGFAESEMIQDIEQVDEGWWSGTAGGQSGLFPAN